MGVAGRGREELGAEAAAEEEEAGAMMEADGRRITSPSAFTVSNKAPPGVTRGGRGRRWRDLLSECDDAECERRILVRNPTRRLAQRHCSNVELLDLVHRPSNYNPSSSRY